MTFKSSLSPFIIFSKKLEFKYHKLGDWKLFVESPSVRAMRAKYFSLLNQYKSERKYITYVDETYLTFGQWNNKNLCNQLKMNSESETHGKAQRLIIVHGGGINGFVNNALLILNSDANADVHHKGMNYEIFSKWMMENYLPNLPENSVIVLDNAPYHNVQLVRAPNMSSRKGDMKKWLDDIGISYSPTICKPELYAKVLDNKEANIKYKIDEIIKTAGHSTLRLPPYHTELNPIETIWELGKKLILKGNLNDNIDDVCDKVVKEFAKITADDWQNAVNRVEKIEKFYVNFNPCLDATIQNVLLIDNYEDENAISC